jgi:hypothetical protein
MCIAFYVGVNPMRQRAANNDGHDESVASIFWISGRAFSG